MLRSYPNCNYTKVGSWLLWKKVAFVLLVPSGVTLGDVQWQVTMPCWGNHLGQVMQSFIFCLWQFLFIYLC